MAEHSWIFDFSAKDFSEAAIFKVIAVEVSESVQKSVVKAIHDFADVTATIHEL